MRATWLAVVVVAAGCGGGAMTAEDAGVDAGSEAKGDGGRVKQSWATVADGGCRTALDLDDGTFILARVCPSDAGRLGMASQGRSAKTSETELRLTHSLSTCRAQLQPGTVLVVAYEKPELVVPLSPPSRLVNFPNGVSGGDGGTAQTTLGCFESDGGFTVHPWG